ncbi:MAG: type transporter [Actinotalea sp.]|nr:type transporter [Actinotalea sp.]
MTTAADRRAPGFELRGESTPPGAWLRGVWAARTLVAVLARKEFLVRYRRASFGVPWAVGLPLLQAVVLAVVFSQVVRFETASPYWLFVFTGVVPAAFVLSTITASSTSIVDGSSLSSKVWFTRAVLPLATVLASLYGAVASLALVVLAVVAAGEAGARLVLLVPAVVLAVALSVGAALVGSALQVWFRDTRYLLQAVAAVWLYATPVVYPLSLLPGALRRVVEANPASGVVELFRAATVGAESGLRTPLLWSVGWTLALLVLGVVLHSRGDRVFADRL